MAEYIPSPGEWMRDQVAIYERSGGTEGTTLRVPDVDQPAEPVLRRAAGKLARRVETV